MFVFAILALVLVVALQSQRTPALSAPRLTSMLTGPHHMSATGENAWLPGA